VWGVKNLGAFFAGLPGKKPGYPLQSFLPPAAKKDFRFYPLRMVGRPFRANTLTKLLCNFSGLLVRPL
jgi:hypothetical protein